MQKPLILCADDDQSTLDLLNDHLEVSGYDVTTVQTGEEVLPTALELHPALILLGALPGDFMGFDALKALRQEPVTSVTPVVLLPATYDEVQIVRGFELGADDCLVRPFGIRELQARIKAILRRSLRERADDMIRIGPLTIDGENYEAFRNGEKMVLTLKEYELLKLLASSPGKVLTRDFLLDRIWGYEFYGETRTVDVHIRHIRQKLGDDADMIETVRGVGYKMRVTA